MEFEGTYPLPEAQVDRFMLKILVNYPAEPQEVNILDMVESGFDSADLAGADLESIVDTFLLNQLRGVVRRVRVEEMVRRYITQIVRATRTMSQAALGASPRAGVMLLLAAKAHAVVSGREFVTPDNVKTMSLPVLRHRILLNPEIEVEGRTSDDCLKDLLLKVEVPR